MTEVSYNDTIAAIATPPGRGGVGVIRVSGPHCLSIANALLKSLPNPREAAYRAFLNEQHEVIDSGLALLFPKPHSFTGEDVLELQGHGGPVVMQILLEAIIQQGARMAEPGEFTHRAFLNGKLDLAQAEAVADLIDASTKEAALGATRSLQGVFSEKINELSESILHLRILVESGIDFSDEEIEFLSDTRIVEHINDLIEKLRSILSQARKGQLVKDGISIAIVGQPNAGKSSLLNYLTQEKTAIVTPIPGTTRDLVKASIQIDGLPVHLVDTAGIRMGADEIEQEGIERSKEQQRLVDRVLLLIDSNAPQLTEIEKEIIDNYPEKVTLVYNKMDLHELPLMREEGAFYISAKTGEGISSLLAHIKHCFSYVGGESSLFLSRERHIQALNKSLHHVVEAKRQLEEFFAFELAAEELRYAQDSLGSIVGKLSSDDLLGEIFSTFCIGK